MRKYITNKIFLLIIVSIPFILFAEDNKIDTNEYKKLESSKGFRNLLKNSNFEQGNISWSSLDNKKSEIVVGVGRNGTLGCRLELSSKYTIISQSFNLKPNTRYRFGSWIKTYNVQKPGASICLERYRKTDGKYAKPGTYLRNLYGTNDWTLIEGCYVTSNEAEEFTFRIGLYARKESKNGTIFFDDVFVEEDGSNWNTAILNPPESSIYENDANFEFASYINGKFNYKMTRVPLLKAKLSYKLGDKLHSYIAPVKEQRINFNITKLPPGLLMLKLELLDVNNKINVDRKNFNINVHRSDFKPKVKIDKLGRTWVDGKPFMPVGVYLGIWTTKEVEIISASPFNCILPYGSMYARSEDKNLQGIPRIRQVLDLCHEKKLKVIFSLKDVYPNGATRYAIDDWNGIKGPDEIAEHVVNGLKDHPALLAWYIADEIDVGWRKQLISRRRQVNEIDRNHPVFAVFYQTENLQHYFNGFDILGVDAYPIVKKNSNDMKESNELIKAGQSLMRTDNGGCAFWTVPQMSNLGLYNPDAKESFEVYKNNFRDPTYMDMLSISILGAIHGAKGFIFYAFNSLTKGWAKASFEERWVVICEVAKELRELEPFILGEQINVEIEPKEGLIEAAAFKANDGSVCILIAAIGPGTSKAIIRLPGNVKPLKSVTGKTISIGNGRHLFTGQDICSDIIK